MGRDFPVEEALISGLLSLTSSDNDGSIFYTQRGAPVYGDSSADKPGSGAGTLRINKGGLRSNDSRQYSVINSNVIEAPAEISKPALRHFLNSIGSEYNHMVENLSLGVEEEVARGRIGETKNFSAHRGAFGRLGGIKVDHLCKDGKCLK